MCTFIGKWNENTRVGQLACTDPRALKGRCSWKIDLVLYSFKPPLLYIRKSKLRIESKLLKIRLKHLWWPTKVRIYLNFMHVEFHSAALPALEFSWVCRPDPLISKSALAALCSCWQFGKKKLFPRGSQASILKLCGIIRAMLLAASISVRSRTCALFLHSAITETGTQRF